MARPRIRSNDSQLKKLFSPWTSTGWRVTRNISMAEGERNVELGIFRRVLDASTGQHVGYQPVEKAEPVLKSSDVSRAALGVAEVLANAGVLGASRTAHLTDEQRATRIHPKSGRLLPEEDFVERTHKLMKAYPFSANFRDIELAKKGRLKRGLAAGGDRAVRVYPRAPVTAGAH